MKIEKSCPFLELISLMPISLGHKLGQWNIPMPTWFEYSYLNKSQIIIKMSFKKKLMKNYMSQVQNGQESTSSSIESENNSLSPRSLVFRGNKWVRPNTTSTSSSDEG